MTDANETSREDALAQEFFAMKYKSLAEAVPEAARETVAASICAHFDVKGNDVRSEKGFGTLLMRARLRLMSMPDQEASKHVVARAVLAAQEIATPNGTPAEPTRDVPARPGAKKDTDKAAFLFVAPKQDAFRPIGDDYPSLLLPHPGDVDRGRFVGYWLSGRCWNAGAIAISFPLDPDAGEAMTEAEAEYAAAPDIFAARIGVKPLRPATPGKNREAWLLEAGERGADEDPAEVKKAFARAVGRALGEIDPDQADRLAAHGACLEMGDDALRLVACAMTIERLFHPEMMDEPDPERRYLAHGAISPDQRHYAGVSLTRAAGYHIVTGAPLSEALSEALAELRLAQVLRITDDMDAPSVIEEFDAKFFSDCRAPLSSYSIAKNEPELA